MFTEDWNLSTLESVTRMPDPEKSAIDKFFDLADQVADKLVAGASELHHPDKVYTESEPDAVDAVIERDHIDFVFTLYNPKFAEGAKPGYHITRGVSNRALCGKVLDQDFIAQRMLPNHGSEVMVKFCVACVSRMLAFQTQVKQLQSGHVPGTSGV